MALERTFSIIKPDATERNLTGAINAVIEKAGLRIVAQKRMRMSRREAETFYAVHKERPFFGELVDFMISGPVVVQVLEGENAVSEVPRDHGRDEPDRRRRGHDPQAVRASRSARTRSTAPTARTTPRPRSCSSSRAMRSSGSAVAKQSSE